ncbi:MAG: hypothetical protein ABR584_04215 [Candidatus Baltobacteraceae bacterium]
MQPAAGGANLKAAFYDAVRRKAYPEAVLIGQRYLAANPNDEVFALDDAYALLDAGRIPEAIGAFRRLSSSKNAAIATPAAKELAQQLLQRSYDLSAKGDHSGAILDLQEYLGLVPGDEQARLQLGYEYTSAGRNAEARAEFATLAKSSKPEIAAKATAALANLEVAPTTAYSAPRGSVYGYVMHDSRFADTFYGADLKYDLGSSKIVPYIVAHLSNDTSSGAPGASEVFNDDALVLSAGARTALSKRLTLFAEGGWSTGLRGKESFAELRYGLTYYAEFGALPRGHTTIDASAVEYSRYANMISYASLTHDFPVAGTLRGVAGINTAVDAQRLYYNNFGEAFAGLQLGLGSAATLRLVHVYGTYWERGILPPQRSYESTRAELLFGISFK